MTFYIIFLVAIMILTVAFLMLGGVSLLKHDDEQIDQIDKDLKAALLK